MKSKNKTRFTQIRRNKHQIRVGGLVRKLAIRGENRQECAEFVTKLVQELDPQTEMEKLLVEKIIFLWWKLRRLFEIERIVLSQQNRPEKQYDDWSHGVENTRVRNLKNTKVYSPEMQEVIGQQIATEKALSKSIEQYYSRRHRQT